MVWKHGAEGSSTTPRIGKLSLTHLNLKVLRTPDLLKEDEMINALKHVVGSQKNIASVCIGPDDDMERRRSDILKSVEKVNDGAGVVVLTNMFGGTPSNLAISIMVKVPIEVIAGVNLPMFVKLASIRKTLNLSEAVARAKKPAKNILI